jgi:hypothetical protein
MIRDVHPGSGSLIRILIFYLPIPDPGVKKSQDPGSATLVVSVCMINECGLLLLSVNPFLRTSAACRLNSKHLDRHWKDGSGKV